MVSFRQGYSRVLGLAGLFLAFSFVSVVAAQDVRQTVVSEDAQQLSVRFDFAWPLPLAALRDSLSASLDGGALAVALARGSLTASRTIPIGSRSASVAIVASEYDELDFAGQERDELLAGLASPVATVEGVGFFRKRLVGSVVVRAVAFDSTSQRIRRYRSLTVRVNRSAPLARTVAVRSSPNEHLLVTESVLATGFNYKVPLESGGVYKIDRQFLVELGLDPATIDPGQIRVFGNGGNPLPAVNDESRIPDLAELGVVVTGGGDGSFAAGDAVVFYTDGVINWAFDDARGEWEHNVNPFDELTYVFVKIGGGAGRELAPASGSPANPDLTLSAVDGRFVVDFDEYIWSKEHGSGHTWVSNPIRIGGRLDVLLNESLPTALPGTYEFSSRVAVKSNPSAFVSFWSGGTNVARQRAAFAISPNSDQPTAAATDIAFSRLLDGGPVDLTLRVDSSQINDPQAALDWLRVVYPRRNQAVDGVLRWHSGTDPGLVQHTLLGFSSEPVVLDVTNHQEFVRLPVWQTGSDFYTQVQVPAGSPKELVAFDLAAATPASAEGAELVPNQNLHGITSYPAFVIVTPALLAEAANELAEYRRADGLAVEVVDVDQIYNEFSGGQKDMRAVRDYFKFLYDRAPGDAERIRYALLMGDGHFDFRNLRQGIDQTPNLVLPYETEETFNPDASYSSDDYFGLLDDNEGLWTYRGYSVSSSERVDIGVGRFPVQTLEEASAVVAKIRHYEDPATAGAWRTRYTFVADDAFTGANGSQAEGDLHLYNMDSVAEYVRENVLADLNPRKVYAESFDRVFVSEYKVPGARQQLLESIDEGSLIFNYSGHGGPRGLAQEDLFTYNDALSLQNRDKLPVFIAATCSFGWWDIDDSQSGAEALLLNENGGAVALFTTVRLVYTSPSPSDLNPGLNRALNVALFKSDSTGQYVRFGDAMVETKNTGVGVLGNSRKFNLLGDPTMRIGLPTRRVRVDTMNDTDLALETGQARALDRITITGSVTSADGSVDAGFNGKVALTVFDAERRVPITNWRWMPNPYYNVREDLLWRGDVGVANGAFSATFVVPKDIAYSNSSGRVSGYATSTTDQAVGYSESFLVGGTTTNPPDDSEGPQISLFLNDTTYVSGGMVPADPELIVRLFDESGINTVGAGVGHEMLVVIDGDESNAIDLATSFQSDEGSYQSGEARYKLDDLPPGPGSLSVRAWDVLNNSGLGTLEYFVAADEALSIRNVYNYPNPMSTRTRFILEHNQFVGTPASLEIKVYTLNGRVVRTIPSEDALPSGILSAGPLRVVWDGRDDDFDRLASGIYLYKVRLETEATDGSRQVAEQIERIALIR